MKILITGSRGQLGSALIPVLQDHDIISAPHVSLASNRELQDIVKSIRPHVVVNTSAYNDVRNAYRNLGIALRLNTHLPADLADVCASVGAYLITFSTDYVFDGQKRSPYVEDDITAPINTYGITKEFGERLTLVYPDACVIRTSRVYTAISGFPRRIANRLMSEGTVSLPVNQIGSFTFAGDLAYVVARAIKERLTGLWHYANAGTASWYYFACAARSAANLPGEIRPSLQSDGIDRPEYSALSSYKISSTLGISIPHWRDSLFRAISRSSARA